MAREKAPAFQFYPADLIADDRVMAMSAEAFGVYWWLVSICWMRGSLPDDVAACADLCRGKVSARRFAALWPTVRACFVLQDGELRHKRLDRERAAQQDWREQSRRGGQASARKRAEQFGSANPRSNREPECEPNVNRPVHKRCEPNVNSSSSSSSSEEEPPTPDADLADDDPLETDASWLLREYPRWYAEERHGARYLVRPAHDGRHAIDLTTAWPDRAQLETMARTYLRSVKLGPFHNARSLAGFAAEASGIDAYLRSEAS